MLKFINHACFQIEVDGYTCLVDPWFEGRVFNDSWSLLEDTNIDDLDLSKLKYIFYSHEHPDHLNWKTLSLINKKCKNDLVVVLLNRKNKNIVNAIKKMKISVAEIEPGKLISISNNFSLMQFPTGHDSAHVFKINDKVVVNQNDCYLDQHQTSKIKSLFPLIDYWFIQFSLAGYYANSDDEEGLIKARDFHIEVLDKYKKAFNPKTTVPFASFVYFCKNGNKFLNDYIITPKEIDHKYRNENVFFLKPGDTELACVEEHRRENVDYWQQRFESDKTIFDHKLINVDKIRAAFDKFLEKNDKTLPAQKVSLYLLDHDLTVEFDYQEGEMQSYSGRNKNNIAEVYSEDLYGYYAFPWGADTLNITSCFKVLDFENWKQFLVSKDMLYERF